MGIDRLRVIDTGLDPVTAEREQWDDGNNTLALAPRLAWPTSATPSPTPRSRRPASTVWCGPPAVSQPSVEVGRSGRGSQTARATGSFGSGSSGSTTSISLATQRNRSPRSHQPDDDAGPGRREHQPDRVLAAADAQRVDLAATGLAGDRRADLEHVRAEDLRLARARW
jgi:hypothetical protein